MARGEVDPVDLVAMPFFAIAALFANNVIPGSEMPYFNPNGVLLQLGPETSITYATVVALAALAVVIWTNKPRLNIYGGIQAWLVVVTVALILAPPFVPLLGHYIGSNMILGIVSFVVQTTGYVIISFMG